MGREISPDEHNMPGIVTVGRPVRGNLELPPEIYALQQRRLGEIEALKQMAKLGVSEQVEVEEQAEF